MDRPNTTGRLAKSETLNLTFDDGPDPAWTPRVLAELRRSNATATFFMVGERVCEHPDVVRSVIDDGHDVQLHCHRHIRHTQMTEGELRDDTERALEALTRVGIQPRLWRPPWGVLTEATVAVADSNELQLRRWSIDTHDWRGDSAQEMIEHAHPRLSAGGSVLMHDALGPGATRDGCANTVALIPRLVQAARALGLAVESMLAPTAQARAS